MNFDEHSELKGTHAPLSPSKPYWLNYNEDKLVEYFYNLQAAQMGTEDHEFAAKCIERNQFLPDDGRTLSMYVNDAIRYKMTPEVCVYYSPLCYGRADALMFRRKILRIHDLKTGVTKPNVNQLRVYAALFCLEHKVKPEDIKIELRFYQSNEVFVDEPEAIDIREIMRAITNAVKVLSGLNEKVGGSLGK